MNPKTLNDYKLNEFSQYGEDGIIKEILNRLNLSSGVCVEFGAWDGILFSNTASLWTKGWKGVLIESDKDRVEILKNTTSDYNCLPLNEFVMPAGNSSIENILERNSINFSDVKVLSIDIDGNEYHIINGLTKLHPPIIIAEYNPTIPPEMDVVSKEDAYFGSSASALVRLGEEKGYKLVAVTESNCFFVDKMFEDKFSDLNTTFENLVTRKNLTYLITGYAGAYAFSQRPAYGMGLPFRKELIESGELFFFNHSAIQKRLNDAKGVIKTIFKKVISPKIIHLFRKNFTYATWLFKGKPIPAHGLYKWKVISDQAKKYGLKTFIETGTAGGGTVLGLSNKFDRLYTIELDPTLFHQGKSNTKYEPKIICLQGDSGIILNSVLKEITNPSLFWLDAHYSGNGTARGLLDTPIIQELKSIFMHPIKNHVILIDDAREFNGTNDYPQLSELEDFIKKEAKQYQLVKDNDLLIIKPKLNEF